MQKYFRTYWLPLVFLITFTCGLVYGALQQNYRQNAYDPGIQIAEDAMYGLVGGVTPNNLAPANKVEIGQRVSPFIMVFGADKTYLAGSAVIDGKAPTLPPGVLDYTKIHGEDRLTWQPRVGIRIATVIKYNGTYFVLVGRNLREVESRISLLGKQVLFAWFIGIISSFVLVKFLLYLHNHRQD